jgi:hypothetical protein
MSLPVLDRRMVLRGGVAVAGCLAVIPLSREPASAPVRLGTLPATGALVGRLVLAPDGGGRIDIFALDATSHPVRQLGSATILPVTSVAGTAHQANNVVVRTIAASWQVRAEDCVCEQGRIEHRLSGRSIPFRIWTDFA